LKTEEELWNERERCNTLYRKEATLDSVLVHHHKDLFSDLVSRVDSQEWKLQVKDFRLRNGRFNPTTSCLLALHHHHLRETTLDRVPWHGDPVSTVGRTGISLTGVRRSSRVEPECSSRCKSDSQPHHQHDYSSKAESSSCSCESCGSRRCSRSSGHYLV
jgi:hypothetical protein